MIAERERRSAAVASAATEQRLEARFLEAREAASIAAAWRDLFHAAAEANPFYGPDFLLPLLDLGGKPANARFLSVTGGERLVGLCPIMRQRFGLPGLGVSLTTLAHPFIFNGLPLMRAGFELAAWRAMLDALKAEYGRGRLCIEALPLGGPVATSLVAALAASSRPHLLLDPGERAGIIASGPAQAHLARIKPRTLSKLKRNERELAKRGKLGFRAVDAGAGLAEAVEAFIALEGRSWKGRQGSAFASDPALIGFARRALATGGNAPGLRAELLTLDERPVAIFLHLVASGYAATFKIAHDEELARHAPGVVTMRRCLEGLLAAPWTKRLDSGAPPEHAVGAIWQDRFPAGRMLLALSPRQSERELRLVAKAHALESKLRGKARDAYYRLTGRKRTQARKATG
jgi:CelD/BcsL family acetyltransferase involved in cellulose biosynthesis